MQIRFAFDTQTFTVTLNAGLAARELLTMLPLDLTIDDYAHNEKIAYLPTKLTARPDGPFGNERPGNFCYYAPWGNLVFFHGGYRYSAGLVRLGQMDGSIEPIRRRGRFALRAELLT